jgi:hypothetical protein
MLKPTLPGSTPAMPPSSPGARVGHRGGVAGTRHTILTPALLVFRRLRFYRDLLLAGYRCALRPDPTPRSLRAERIALGIDHPELDAVPLWSVRRGDGAVAVPFVEFILGEMQRALDAICDALDTQSAPRSAKLKELGADLRRVLETIGTEGGGPALPRLSELFLTGDTLERLCGSPGGLLEQIVRACDSALLAGAGRDEAASPNQPR